MSITDFSDKTALVTGAPGAIGKGVAKGFLEAYEIMKTGEALRIVLTP